MLAVSSIYVAHVSRSVTRSGTVLDSISSCIVFDLAVFLTCVDMLYHTQQESVLVIVYFYFVLVSLGRENPGQPGILGGEQKISWRPLLSSCFVSCSRVLSRVSCGGPRQVRDGTMGYSIVTQQSTQEGVLIARQQRARTVQGQEQTRGKVMYSFLPVHSRRT